MEEQETKSYKNLAIWLIILGLLFVLSLYLAMFGIIMLIIGTVLYWGETEISQSNKISWTIPFVIGLIWLIIQTQGITFGG
ncbi:hypothetical protein [Mangrovimonas sp. TPBH4]|uniref:hypothetical protein n=1 Tax=Mangrovimonas sp. TPBH4 TaxID=1645914 RepID=UPI0006B58694|nr:hypothetical protein [Mangrovimonas sp. TPBH4]